MYSQSLGKRAAYREKTQEELQVLEKLKIDSEDKEKKRKTI